MISFRPPGHLGAGLALFLLMLAWGLPLRGQAPDMGLSPAGFSRVLLLDSGVDAYPLSPGATLNPALFDGYRLLDEISPDSVASGKWQLEVDHIPREKIRNLIRQKVLPSPFPAPAGGLALFQSNRGSDFVNCNAVRLEREFELDRLYSPMARLGVFLKCVRKCDSCHYDFAGILITTFVPEELGNELPEKSLRRIVGTSGAHLAKSAELKQLLPNGFSGFVEVPLDWAKVPFRKIRVSLYNYCCVGDNETILDHVMIKESPPL